MDCSTCHSFIAKGENFLHCSDDNCFKTYHIRCTGSSIPSENTIKTWVCPECTCTLKQGGDNTLNPVGLSDIERDSYVTHRKKGSSDKQDATTNSDSNKLAIEMSDLRQELIGLRSHLTHMVSVISVYDSKLLDYDSKLVRCEARLIDYASEVKSLHSKLMKYECSSLIEMNAALHSQLPSQYQDLPRVITPSYNTSQKKSPNKQSITRIMTKPEQEGKSKDSVPRKPTEQAGHRPSPIYNNEIQAVDLTDEVHDSRLESSAQHWTEIKKKNRKHDSLYGTANSNITTLKAVELRRYIHLWNMESETEEIQEYLQHLCPYGKCTVEKLIPKGNYKSYKIGILSAYYNTCLSADVWPINARIKAWVNLRRPFFNSIAFRKELPCNPSLTQRSCDSASLPVPSGSLSDILPFHDASERFHSESQLIHKPTGAL